MSGTRAGATLAGTDATTAGAGASAEDVARYYDSNTRRFLLLGSARGVPSLHRELWGPGVRSSREAAQWIDRALADEIDPGLAWVGAERPVAGDARGSTGREGSEVSPVDGSTARPVVLDFGCGVGGTLFHLAARFPGARLRGVTVSARQIEIAERFAAELGLGARCSFALGDFHTIDLGLRADAIVAVESFAHSGNVDAFLANACRHLRPGGRLVVVDDFLAADAHSLDARRRRHVEELREGWRAPAVAALERLTAAATLHGLVAEKVVDLTPLTRPGSRARDRLLGVVSPLLARLRLARIPFWGNMIGGHALQVGLREGFIRYLLVVLRKGTVDGPRVAGPSP